MTGRKDRVSEDRHASQHAGGGGAPALPDFDVGGVAIGAGPAATATGGHVSGKAAGASSTRSGGDAGRSSRRGPLQMIDYREEIQRQIRGPSDDPQR